MRIPNPNLPNIDISKIEKFADGDYKINFTQAKPSGTIYAVTGAANTPLTARQWCDTHAFRLTG